MLVVCMRKESNDREIRAQLRAALLRHPQKEYKFHVSVQ